MFANIEKHVHITYWVWTSFVFDNRLTVPHKIPPECSIPQQLGNSCTTLTSVSGWNRLDSLSMQ